MIRLIAHRGIHNAKIKENTYLSIFNAINNDQVHGVEFDIRLTKDKNIVLIHDSFINRTSNGVGKVEHMTLKQLQRYNYGSKKFSQSIPTLEKILEIDTNKIFLIEIKIDNNDDNFANALLKVLNKYSNKKIYIMSLNKNVINLLMEKNNTYKYGVIYLINNIKNFKYDFYVLQKNFLSNKLINKLNAKNKEIFIWDFMDNNNFEYDINNLILYYIVNL